MSSSSHLAAPSPAEESPSPERSEDSQVRSLSIPGLLAGGAAAATTSVIGGQLGISGTVTGAAITSVISAAVVAFYTDSVNGTARKLKQVAARTGERAPGRDRSAAVHASRTRREADGGARVAAAEAPAPARGRRLMKIALMSVVTGLIGMAAVFGIQRISGTELSPGTGQIQRSVTGTDSVSPREDSGSSTDDGTEQQDGTGEQQDGTGADGTDGTGDEGTGTDGTSTDGTGGTGEQGVDTSEDGAAPADGQQGGDADESGGSSGSAGTSGSGSGASSGSGSGSGQGAAADGSGTSEQIG